MSSYPTDLRYTNDHEWLRSAGTGWRVGITQFAVNQLGDITIVELPKVGDTFGRSDVFGTIEAVKAVSELFAPISGEIVEVNPRLDKEPNLVNTDPYGDGWMVRIRMKDSSEQEQLLGPEEYGKQVGQ